MKGKILVAMSGGVDSSSVASKMLEEGYEVEGVTMKFANFCSELAVIDAKKVAKQLNIKHHVLELGNEFEDKVIKYFVNEYSQGRTPNPCIKCNREIKFGELLKLREKIGADFLVTGHYAKISKHSASSFSYSHEDENPIIDSTAQNHGNDETSNEYWLERGKDILKDQSYFLSQIKYEYLQYIKFPLADIEKIDVRRYAKNLGLVVAEKPESQDICFTAGKDYKEILKNYHVGKSGDIFHINGEKLGTHSGIINYTRGQRKGLELGGGYKEPLYVVDLNAEKNIVYVGAWEDLFKNTLTIKDVNFLDKSLEIGKPYKFGVKLRHIQALDMAKIIFNSDGTANVELDKPSRNIAKGQVCCMYRGDRVVASGYIILFYKLPLFYQKPKYHTYSQYLAYFLLQLFLILLYSQSTKQ
jgi:tRNA-specific 2-thiouridylase